MSKRAEVIAITLLLALVPSVAFAAGGEHGDHGGFPWGHWLASMVNFAIFAGILWWKALPMIQDHFKERSMTLRADIEEAKQLREEAQKKLDEYSSRLEKLDDERAQLMDEYHKAGEREKDKIVADAKRQVDKMRADAELLINQEVRKAVHAIERQAVDLAVDMARKSLESKIDDRMQNTLVDGYVTELKSVEG